MNLVAHTGCSSEAVSRELVVFEDCKYWEFGKALQYPSTYSVVQGGNGDYRGSHRQALLNCEWIRGNFAIAIDSNITVRAWHVPSPLDMGFSPDMNGPMRSTAIELSSKIRTVRQSRASPNPYWSIVGLQNNIPDVELDGESRPEPVGKIKRLSTYRDGDASCGVLTGLLTNA